MNLKELGQFLENWGRSKNNFSNFIVWGGGNSWAWGGKFPKKWCCPGDYNSGRESITLRLDSNLKHTVHSNSGPCNIDLLKSSLTILNASVLSIDGSAILISLNCRI